MTETAKTYAVTRWRRDEGGALTEEDTSLARGVLPPVADEQFTAEHGTPFRRTVYLRDSVTQVREL